MTVCRLRVLGCNDSVKSVLQLGDTNGDSLINEDEFRILASFGVGSLCSSWM